MAKKTKANLQYTQEGSDKPKTGQLMMFNGTEFIPVNDAFDPITSLFVLNHITIAGVCSIKVVSGNLCFYQIGQGGSETLRARLILSTGDIEGFSTP